MAKMVKEKLSVLKHTIKVILNTGTRWRTAVNLRFWPLYPWRKIPWYPQDRRLDKTGLYMVAKRLISASAKNPVPVIQPKTSHFTGQATLAH